MWQNKIEEIQLLVDDHNPDIAFITEANLWEGTNDHEILVEGYEIIKPKTTSGLGYSRVVALIREGFQTRVLNEYMEDDLSSIWLKIGGKGSKALIIGGMYREHTLLGYPLSVDPQEQRSRWKRLLGQWRRACNGAECLVIGDLNIEMGKS